MTKLAIQYPWRYASVFEEYCDFHVWDMLAMPKDTPQWPECPEEKELWIDCSKCNDYEPEEYDGIILPTYDEPGRNLLNAAKERVSGVLNIGIWRGEKRHLQLMHDAVDIVSLPFYEPGRTLYIAKDRSREYHYYEFCNLDELRRMPPRSIHTSVPITAAIVGVDLRQRERRPRCLSPFSYDLRLSDSQLELAVSNVKAIKEALDSGGADET